MTKTVVVLGAGMAGVSITHWLLKHMTAKMPQVKVVLVSPNTHFFWNLAAPRLILPDEIPDDEVFLPLQPLFAKYSADNFQFILGRAERLDPDTKSVSVSSMDQALAIAYDTLVIATGSMAVENMPFKTLSNTNETIEAIHTLRSQIQAAKSIIVGGAGSTGVEVAGELGHVYSLNGSKEVILISSKELLLSDDVRKDIREITKTELENLKVTVITDSHTSSITELDGRTLVEVVSGGEKQSLLTDLFIPTYGIVPNTSFLPESMLDSRGYVNQNCFLQAEGHDDIFVIGDAGNLQPPQAKSVEDQLTHIVKNLDAHITKTGEITEYKPDSRFFLGISIGPTSGTGQFGNWKLWKFLVTFMKSRTLGLEYAKPIAAGERTRLQRKW